MNSSSMNGLKIFTYHAICLNKLMKNVLHPKIEQLKEEELNRREAKRFSKKIVKGNP